MLRVRSLLLGRTSTSREAQALKAETRFDCNCFLDCFELVRANVGIVGETVLTIADGAIFAGLSALRVFNTKINSQIGSSSISFSYSPESILFRVVNASSGSTLGMARQAMLSPTVPHVPWALTLRSSRL